MTSSSWPEGDGPLGLVTKTEPPSRGSEDGHEPSPDTHTCPAARHSDRASSGADGDVRARRRLLRLLRQTQRELRGAPRTSRWTEARSGARICASMSSCQLEPSCTARCCVSTRALPAQGSTSLGSRTTAAGYFDYFGSRAGPRGKGWYSYDIGSWHLIALNSACTEKPGEVSCTAGLGAGAVAAPRPSRAPNSSVLAYWRSATLEHRLQGQQLNGCAALERALRPRG